MKNKYQSDTFNPDMLIIARQSRGYTQKQLADLITPIRQSKLSKIESGIQNVSIQEAESMATALNYPVDFFYQKELSCIPSISGLFHRKRATLSAKTLDKVHASIEIKCIQVKKLLNSISIDHLPIPSYNVEDATPAEIARMTRVLWQLPRGPVRNLIDVIESAGGIIIPMDFGTDKIDAISRRTTSNVPLFFVDFSRPMDRIRFSLAHELGHMIMHKIPSKEIEVEANDFAAEFLMPENDIKEDLENLTLRYLPTLKLKWKTSMAALIYRANDVSCIDEERKQHLYIQLSKRGYKSREPKELEPVRELPSLFYDLLKLHITDLKYTKKELSKLLLINENELDELFPSDRPKLKIIKNSFQNYA